MPYTDRWDVYKGGTVSVALDTLTKIIGTSSLAFVSTNTQSQVNLVPTLAGGLPQPALRGKIRNVIRAVSLGSGARRFGIAALQSVRNITVSGNAYLVYIDGSELIIGKTAAGLTGAITILKRVGFTLITGLNYVIEFEWNSDNVQLAGVDLLAGVRAITDLQSNQTEFTNMPLTTKLHVIDTTAPLTTTLGQGPIFVTPASGGTVDIRYDSTVLFAV